MFITCHIKMSNPGSGSDHYNIPLLDKNGSNYDNWKFRVFALLKIKGLMEIVRGIEKCPPEKATDPKDQVTVTITFDKWHAQNDQTFVEIVITLKKELSRKIRQFELLTRKLLPRKGSA